MRTYSEDTRHFAKALPLTALKRTAETAKQLPNLDMLRSFAVLAVLVDHIAGTFGIAQRHVFLWTLGRWGVLLFFIHTSFVLMMSLERLEARGWRMYGVFYLRRFARIYPLSTVTIAIVLLAHIPENSWTSGFQMPGKTTVLMNFLLLCGPPAEVHPVLGPLWSLPYEVEMYLVLPMLFTLLRRNSSRAVLALVWIGSFGFGLLQALLAGVRGSGFGRLDLAQFAPCFLAGVVAYFLMRQPRRVSLQPWVWPCILCVSTAAYLNIELQWFYTYRIVSWVACLLVAFGLVYCAESKYRALNQATHYIAKYSYGLYLGQVPVLWFAFVKLHSAPALIQWPTFLILIFLVPILSYHLIEEPCVRLAKRTECRPLRPEEHTFTESPAVQ
jgi:peptidoglycan/LPS O-acetylase OafA/YrhL